MNEYNFVVKLADREYVETYDLASRKVCVTDDCEHADRFVSKLDADYVAERLGGYVEDLSKGDE